MTTPGPLRGELSFEASRTTYSLHLVCALAFVAIGAWTIGAGAAWVGGLAVLFFGGCAAVFLRQMVRGGPRLTIDGEGLHDRTLGVGVIRWEDVVDARPAEMAGQSFIALTLRDPDAYLARLGVVRRVLARANRSVGFPSLSLNLSGLRAADAEAIATYVRAEAAARRAA